MKLTKLLEGANTPDNHQRQHLRYPHIEDMSEYLFDFYQEYQGPGSAKRLAPDKFDAEFDKFVTEQCDAGDEFGTPVPVPLEGAPEPEPITPGGVVNADGDTLTKVTDPAIIAQVQAVEDPHMWADSTDTFSWDEDQTDLLPMFGSGEVWEDEHHYYHFCDGDSMKVVLK